MPPTDVAGATDRRWSTDEIPIGHGYEASESPSSPS